MGQTPPTSCGTPTTNFPSSPAPQLLSDAKNFYIYGPDGLPLSQINQASGQHEWFAHDTQGNTRALLRQSGFTAATYDYGTSGNTNQAIGGQADTPLKFQGQYEDKESGLIYLRARYHDPRTNQFITVDPLEAQTGSKYGYAGNDGVNLSDPSGLCIGWGCKISDTAFGTGLVNVSAGVINGLTFGNGNWVFGKLGMAGYYDQCDFAYAVGGAGGEALGVGLAGGVAARVGSRAPALATLLKGRSAKSATGAEFASRGSTGRTVAESLKEQLAMESAKADPLAGSPLTKVILGDSRWPSSDGWIKMQERINGVVINYVRNIRTGAVDDFKFK